METKLAGMVRFLNMIAFHVRDDLQQFKTISWIRDRMRRGGKTICYVMSAVPHVTLSTRTKSYHQRRLPVIFGFRRNFSIRPSGDLELTF